MNRTEFIAELRDMADCLERGTFKFITISDDTHLFANKNHGTLDTRLGVVNFATELFVATDEERKEFDQ
jgi:hypothetical protein